MFISSGSKLRIVLIGVAILIFFAYFWNHLCLKHNESTSSESKLHTYNFRPLDGNKNRNNNNASGWENMDTKPKTFQDAVVKYANGKRIIILSLMDMGCLDMAVNLYLSSYLKMDMTNYLFISSDSLACSEMFKISSAIHCIHYADDNDANKPSSYGSRSFIRKTYFKSQAVQEALLMDYNVLLMDIDIVLFQDPFPYFDKCKDCDLQIQWDHGTVCSGFYFIRATEGGRLFVIWIFITLATSPFGQTRR